MLVVSPIIPAVHGVVVHIGDLTHVLFETPDGERRIELEPRHIDLLRGLLDTAIRVAFRDVVGVSWSAARTDAGLNVTLTRFDDVDERPVVVPVHELLPDPDG